MGGNARHAAKGPDTQSSTCDKCGHDFTRGKFSRMKYCDACRDTLRDPENVETSIEAEHQPDENHILVRLRIANGNDVDVRIPVETAESTICAVGYLRVEGEGCAAEDAWLLDNFYGTFKVRRDTERTMEFVIDDDAITPQYTGHGETAHEKASEFTEMSQIHHGEPLQAENLTATFVPSTESPWMETVTTSIEKSEYLVSLE